jgi:hypothetical protein
VAKLNLDCVLEAFILAAGIPPSVWRATSDQATATARPETRTEKVTPKGKILVLRVRQCTTPTQEGNHDE